MTSFRAPLQVVYCILSLSVTTSVIGQAGPASHCVPLRSTVFPADTGRLRVADGALFHSLVDTATTNLARLEIHVTTLAPGRSPHPPHRHPHEELMIVRSGTLEVVQNDVTHHASSGAVIFEAANELHGLRNPGPDSATYVVIRIDPHDLATSDANRCSGVRR